MAEGKLIISTCCGKCGCPITVDEVYTLYKGIPEHKECPDALARPTDSKPSGETSPDR